MAYLGFNKLKSKLAAKGIKDPGGLAAKIGRAKYGKKKFQHAAAEGESMRHERAESSSERKREGE